MSEFQKGIRTMEEKISIIVPIYNREKYLKRCIDSLLKQTYKNIEIMLVDDCSKDNSAEIAKEYEKKHPLVCRVIQQTSNQGVSAARNLGIKNASGEWVTFVDSDDWVKEEYIEVLYRTAQKENALIVMSNFYYYYSEKSIKEMCPFGNLETTSAHKEKVALSNPCVCTRLFKKELFVKENIYFPEDIRRSEEVATVVPLLCTTDRISLSRKPMYYYFQNESSLSNENYESVDVSCFIRAIDRMMQRSRAGFEEELEFRAVSELMYGMVMVMLRSGKSKKEITQSIDWFENRFPEWRKNSYLKRLEKGKQLFVYLAGKKKYRLLKILIGMWDRVKEFM